MKTSRTIICASLLASLLLAPEAKALVFYATDIDSGFYALNTADFSLTLIGHHTASTFIGGMAFDSYGTLYGISAGDVPNLYTIDVSSGAVTLVGPLQVGFVFEGGLAFDPWDGTLYAVNQGSSSDASLMTIDKATGHATVIGEIASGTGKHDFGGLAFDDLGRLYALDRPTNALWTIDKTNPSGAGSARVGTGLGSGIDMGPAGGMTVDHASLTYYGYASGSHHLFTIDLVTGLGTILHQFGPGEPLLVALAYPGELPTASRVVSWGSLKARYR